MVKCGWQKAKKKLNFKEKRDTRRRKGTNIKEKWDILFQPYSRCRYLKAAYHLVTLERQYIGASQIFLFQIIHKWFGIIVKYHQTAPSHKYPILLLLVVNCFIRFIEQDLRP